MGVDRAGAGCCGPDKAERFLDKLARLDANALGQPEPFGQPLQAALQAL